MSGISANGHGCGYANFRQISYQKSNLVGESQLNKLFEHIYICSQPALNPSFSKKNPSRISGQKINENTFKYVGFPGNLEHRGKSDFLLMSSGDKAKSSKKNVKDKTSRNKNTHSDKKLKILIAEDDDISTQFLTIVIKDLVSEIIFAETGKETVNLCKKHADIDLILMDIKMPEMDGIQATKKIREFNKDIYIIAQTARALDGDREEALNAGCNDYIAKPINRDDLLKKIKTPFI